MPTFDSGDISARLTLDRTPFNRGLEQAKQDAAKFEKRGVNVRLGVDRKGFDAALKRAKADAEKFSKGRYDAKLGVDAKGIQRDLDKVKAELAALKRTRTEPVIKPKVDASELTRLRADLTEVTRGVNTAHVGVDDKKARATILGFKAALAGIDQRLTSNLDIKGVAQIEARLATVNAQLDAFGRKRVTATADVRTSGSGGIDSLVRKINGPGGLVSALLAIAPAAVPVGAAVTGALGAVGAASVAAIAPVSVFGLAVKDSFGAAKTAAQQLSLAQGKVNLAQKALNDAKGPAARTAALKKLTLAQRNLTSLEKSEGPATVSLANNYREVTQALTRWDMKAALPAVAQVANTLMPAIRVGLKAMTPLVLGAGDAFTILGDRLSAAVTGPGGKRFIRFLEIQGPKAIVGFGTAIGHIVTGIGGVILAFAPFQHTLLGGLDSITGKFATWGKNLGSSSGFHQFIAYIKANGPAVGKLLQTAGSAVVAIVKAAAGFGGSELKNMTTVLAALVNFSKAHPTVLKFAVATLALSKAVQALKLASIGGSIAKLLGLLAGAKGAKGVASLLGPELGAGAALGRGAAASGLAARAGSFATAVGGLSVTAVAGLLAAPIVAGIIAGLTSKKRPPLTGPGSLNPNGTPTIPGKVGQAQIDANNGGVFDPGQKGNNNSVRFTAPPAFSGNRAIHAGVFFSAPPTFGPKSGVKKTGKGYQLESQISIQAGINATHPSGKKANIDPNAFGGLTPPGTGDKGRGQGAPPNIPKIKVAVLGADSAKTIIEALGSTIKKVPSRKDIRVAQSGAKTASAAINGVFSALHGAAPTRKQVRVAESGAKTAAGAISGVFSALHGSAPTKKQIKVAESGAKTAASAIGTVSHILSGTPNKKNTRVSTTGAGIAHTAIAAIKSVLGQTPNRKDIHHSTPGAGAAHTAIAAIKSILGQTPNSKTIKHSTPGSAAAHSAIAAIKLVLGQTPNKKDIKHSTPGSAAAHSAIAAIKLVLGQTPNKKTVSVSTPGADGAHQRIISLKDALSSMPKTVNIAMKVIGTASDVLSKGLGFADGGALPLPRRATGGSVMTKPGYVRGPGGGRDDLVTYAPGGVPAARVSNTEYVTRSSIVSRVGVPAMDALNAGYADIVPRFADGGTVLNVNMSGPNVASMKSGIKGFLGGAAKGISKDQAKHLQKELASLGSAGGGNANSWIPVVAQALALLHQPVSLAPLWARTVIANESGGNALAVNRYDINAQNGTPSVGGNQVIGPTFRAYAGPFAGVGPFIAGVSVNRLANTFAALNYAIHAYGSIANTPGIRSLGAGGGYRPYAEGGPIAMHGGGPVQGVHKGASGDWVKALAIQGRQLKNAFHQNRFSGTVSDELNRDWPNHEPHHLPNLAKYDPTVKRLVGYLWGRHGRKTTFDDALGHFSHGRHPMAFLDIMRAFNAGKGYLTEMTGKGKRKHRFIPDSTLSPFRSGLRRYEGLYHHDVQALEHKIDFKPENGVWGAGLDAPVAHVIAHALGKKHSQFAPRPWNPLDAAEKALQAALTSNANNAEFRKDLDIFSGWKLTDLVQTLTGDDIGTALPIARAAARHRAEAVKLNAAYRVADTSILGGHTAPGFARGGRPRAGMAWVGEQGPELVRFRGHEQVHSASQSRRMVQDGDRELKELVKQLAAVAHRLSQGSRGPLIGHADFHDNTDIELTLRKAQYMAETAGL